MGLVITWANLESWLAHDRAGRKLVFTNGCFDLLHVGHVRYLQAARQLGDLLFVGVNSDASVRRLKGPERPIQSEQDRAEILSALGCVDACLVFDEDTPERLIKAVKPDTLVKGGDWPVNKIVGADYVMSYGGDVRSLPFVDGKSTTQLVTKARLKPKSHLE